MHNETSAKSSVDPRMVLFEAIACKRAVTAQYNGVQMRLAPHVLFERRGDLFLSALNMTKNWRSDDEKHLGHFKLDGLGETILTVELEVTKVSVIVRAPVLGHVQRAEEQVATTFEQNVGGKPHLNAVVLRRHRAFPGDSFEQDHARIDA